jgi:pyruvate,water dikinase
MLGDKWINDRTPTERFPHFTRANAADVLADPVTPLGWTWSWESGVVLGCRDGFVSYGVFDKDEYGDPPESFGLFGGYFYNSLTQARMMGSRTPGATAEMIDDAYFDAHPDVPPYVLEDWHESEEHSKKLTVTSTYLLETDKHEPIEEMKILAQNLRDSRPDLSTLTLVELVERAREMQDPTVRIFEQHVWASLAAANGPAILTGILAEFGRETESIKLVTGIGNVDSAEIGRELWHLSRLVRNSESMSTYFDNCSPDLDPETMTKEFRDSLNVFLYHHGSRGPNEWDPGSDTYESNPKLAFGQLDLLRKQDDSADPIAAFERNAAERERLRSEFEGLLSENEEASTMFQVGMKAGELWMALRERNKCSAVKPIHEARMCFNEIARRMVDLGHLDNPKHIYMVLEDEMDSYIEDPSSFKLELEERERDYKSLFELDPPFIINTVCPPLTEWPKKADLVYEPVSVGEEFVGNACSPGSYTGKARVVLDASDPSALEPGEILVTFNTDPAWTPLFLAAGAVVVDLGNIGSHASIVSRELGIPCVASATDASKRIPDGATISVDGTSGKVTIIELP